MTCDRRVAQWQMQAWGRAGSAGGVGLAGPIPKKRESEQLTMGKNELMTVDISAYRGLQPEEQENVREILAENLTSQGFRPEVIKSPSGNARLFEIEGENGPEGAQEIEGVILFKRENRAYFKGEYDSATRRKPDCASADMIHGEGDPGGECKRCPLSQFGGGCLPKMEVLLLREGDLFPVSLRLPVSALSAMTDYLSFLVRRGLRYSQVVTRFGLVEGTITKGREKGRKYSKVHPELGGRLSPADWERVKLYVESVKDLITKMAETKIYDDEDEGAPDRRPGYRQEEEGQPFPEDMSQETVGQSGDQEARITLAQWQVFKSDAQQAGVTLKDLGGFLGQQYQVTSGGQLTQGQLVQLRTDLTAGLIAEWVRQEVVADFVEEEEVI